jgi:hypothetical protein
VNPGACKGYDTKDIGKKIKAFLKATVALDKAVAESQTSLLDTCKAMGSAMDMSDLSGDVAVVCDAVSKELEANLQGGVKANAKLDIEYKPAVCTVDASVSASAQAQCSGSGTAGTGGNAAEGACESSAKVEAALVAKCEPAELTVNSSAEITLDQAKLDKAVAAIKVGVPKLGMIHAKMVVLAEAAGAWSRSAGSLVKAGRSLLSDLGDQVLCVSAQLGAAADAAARITGSISVQVEVSVQVSGSAGASM